jgi:hypothetical protein
VSDAVTHPSPDVLADHHEGLLPSDEALQIGAHISECAECQDFLDALGAVGAALHDVGATRTPMPAAVAAEIEAVLADEAQDRATVISMRPASSRESAADRSRADQSSVMRHRRRSRLLVAAGTVAVLAIGGVVARSHLSAPNGGSSASSKATNERDRASGAGPAAGGANSPDKLGTNGTRGIPPRFPINRQNFESVIPRAITANEGARGASNACLATAVARYRPDSWMSLRVTWSDKPAWVLINPTRKEGYVVDCSGTPRVLYHHAF